MTTVMILHDQTDDSGARFRAVAGDAQSEGKTVGAALDALAEQMGDPTATEGMLVVVRPLRPDSYFTAAEQAELESLMAAWRIARDQNRSLNHAEQARLEELVSAEWSAAARRSAGMARGLRP